MREQFLDRIGTILSRGEHQGRLPPLRFFRIRVRAGVEQQLHDRRVAGGRSQVQRGDAGGCRSNRRIGARLEERRHDRRAARPARQLQRRVLTDARDGGNVGAGIDEHVGHRRVAALGRPVQSGHPVALRRADVRTLLEQVAQAVAVAAHGGVSDRGTRRRCAENRGHEQRGRCVDGQPKLHNDSSLCHNKGNHEATKTRRGLVEMFVFMPSCLRGCICFCYATLVVADGAVSENSPVLSPKLLRSSSPSSCSSVSITFAIGVASAAFRCSPPFSIPFPLPSRTSGHRRWLWMFGSAIGEPQMISVLSSRLASPSIACFIFSRKYGSWPTRNLQILLNSMIRSSRFPWCDAGWNGCFDSHSGNTRFCASRPVLNEMMRVMSVCSASTWMSNISFM